MNTATAAELAELLRSLVRSVANQTPTPPPPPPPPPSSPPLSQEALAAVAEFRRISADLAVATTFTS